MEISAIYGLKYQARCVTAVPTEKERSLFMVGTLSLRECAQNELHVVEYSGRNNEFSCHAVLRHDGEIWALAPHPTRAGLIATVSNDPSAGGFRARVSRITGVDALIPTDTNDSDADDSDRSAGGRDNGGGGGDGGADAALGAELDLAGCDGQIRTVIWEKRGEDVAATENPYAVVIDDAAMRLYDVASGSSDAASTFAVQRGLCAAWNPHHTSIAAVGAEGTIRGIDVRSGESGARGSFTVSHAHAQAVRDIDFNPNRPYHFASCGDDATVRFWDLRETSRPLETLKKHSHWVCQVRYNVYHDQLVVSSGTDSTVNLWNVGSLSSAAIGAGAGGMDDDDDEDGGSGDGADRAADSDAATGGAAGAGPDGLVKTYSEHEDSVYSVAWSCSETDAWVFASLSFDGRVVINHVPQDVKYKILL